LRRATGYEGGNSVRHYTDGKLKGRAVRRHVPSETRRSP
jgi:hypothetical protein